MQTDTAAMAMLREHMARTGGPKPPEPSIGTLAAAAGALDERLARRQQDLERRQREEQLAERRHRARLVGCVAADFGSRYAPEKMGLRSYAVYDREQEAIVRQVLELTTRVVGHVARCGGVILYGTVGTGKDHFLATLLYAAATAGIGCRRFNGQEIFGRFKDRIDLGQADESLFQELARPTVLGISDPLPPIGTLSAWDLNNFYRLVERRYSDCKPTWITMNVETEDEAYEKLSAPIFDRLKENAELVPCFWPSYREQKGLKVKAS